MFEKWNECGGNCQQTCFNLTTNCAANCHSGGGCICKNGFVRINGNCKQLEWCFIYEPKSISTTQKPKRKDFISKTSIKNV